MINTTKHVVTLIAAGFLILSLKIPAIAESEYEMLFKEYPALVEPYVLNKNIEEIEIVSTQFETAEKVWH